MRCIKCGKEISYNAKVCIECSKPKIAVLNLIFFAIFCLLIFFNKTSQPTDNKKVINELQIKQVTENSAKEPKSLEVIKETASASPESNNKNDIIPAQISPAVPSGSTELAESTSPQDSSKPLEKVEYSLIKKEYLCKNMKLYIDENNKKVYVAKVLKIDPNHIDTDGNKYYGIHIQEKESKDKYWKNVIPMVEANIWYIKTSDIKEDEVKKYIDAETPRNYTWINALGNIWVGVKLYYGDNEDKMYVGEVINIDDEHYDIFLDKKFHGVQLKMKGGTIEWKDRDAIVLNKWYVRSDDPILKNN